MKQTILNVVENKSSNSESKMKLSNESQMRSVLEFQRSRIEALEKESDSIKSK